MKNITVLMTGAGAPGAPGIISCYRNNFERRINVVGADVNTRVSTRRQVDQFENIPLASSLDFVDAILTVATKHSVDVVQPLVTKELEIFAKNKKLFNDNGIKICVSPLDNLIIANDKGRLMDCLKQHGLAIPDCNIVSRSEDFVKACQKLGYPEKNVCFKPTQSNGSRGFRIIDDRVDKGRLLFEEKPNSTYIGMDEAEEILSSMTDIPEILVMEYLPGKEYSVDMLVENGETLYCIPRYRKAMNGGISTRCIVENNEDVIRYCMSVAEILKLHGNIGIQVRYSREGEVKILEVNPRVQGSIVACAAAGVNLPYLGIKQALGERIPKFEVKWNIEMVRYWKEVYYDSEGYAFTQ